LGDGVDGRTSFWSEKLDPEIVKALAEVHKLPAALRAARVREINQKLMERIGDAGAAHRQ
jgi:hypothetical protein